MLFDTVKNPLEIVCSLRSKLFRPIFQCIVAQIVRERVYVCSAQINVAISSACQMLNCNLSLGLHRWQIQPFHSFTEICCIQSQSSSLCSSILSYALKSTKHMHTLNSSLILNNFINHLKFSAENLLAYSWHLCWLKHGIESWNVDRHVCCVLVPYVCIQCIRLDYSKSTATSVSMCLNFSITIIHHVCISNSSDFIKQQLI